MSLIAAQANNAPRSLSSTAMTPSGPASPTRPPAPTITPSSPRIHRHNVDGLSDIAKEQDQRFARDIEWKVVGPMPPELFLEQFLPYRTRIPQFDDVTFSNIPDKPRKESEIYTPLVRGAFFLSRFSSYCTQRDELNKVLAKGDSQLAFYDTSNRTESPGKVGSSKPDLGMFRRDDVNRGHLKDTHKRVEGGHSEDYIYTARMGEVYMFIEVKTSDDLDFFTDPRDSDVPGGCRFTVNTEPKPSNDREGWHRLLALGQSTRYAHVIQTRQFRTCVYSISVAGTTARLLRWDRSGLVVTESFNYREDPSHLISLVWRFSKSTDEQRGWDLSAESIDSELGRSQFATAIKRNVREQIPGLNDKEVEEEADRHYWPGAITRLTVGDGARTRSFWVSRPMFTSRGPTGRSTIGYWGVDCKSGEVVFVKDVWRTDVLGVETEGIILEELLRAGVRNIPELVCHGDVVHGGTSISLFIADFGN